MNASQLHTLLGLCLFLLPANLLASQPPEPTTREPTRAGVEILHLGNEGFLLTGKTPEGDTQKVVIDGLYGDGLSGYPAVPIELRRPLEAAEGRFADVDLVLASHLHPDHFNAEAVARHLDANPGARFVSTLQAAELVREAGAPGERVTGFWPAESERELVEHAGIRVTVLRLHHGRAPAQNLGLVIDIGGIQVLHMGDTVITGDEVRPLQLADAGIDVVMAPYWYITYNSYGWKLEDLGPVQIIGMHFPSSGAPDTYFEPHGDLDGVIAASQEVYPEGWMARTPGETRRFTASD